jgi:hypothetical protein
VYHNFYEILVFFFKMACKVQFREISQQFSLLFRKISQKYGPEISRNNIKISINTKLIFGAKFREISYREISYREISRNFVSRNFVSTLLCTESSCRLVKAEYLFGLFSERVLLC